MFTKKRRIFQAFAILLTNNRRIFWKNLVCSYQYYLLKLLFSLHSFENFSYFQFCHANQQFLIVLNYMFEINILYLYGGILLLSKCKINDGNMRNNFVNTLLIYFKMLFVGVFGATREFFTHKETSPLSVKGCKF